MTLIVPRSALGSLVVAVLSPAGNREKMLLTDAFGLFAKLRKKAPHRSQSHLQDHSLRLLANLAAITRHAGDIRLLRVAIILHDIGVFYSQSAEHGRESARIIRPHLADLGLTAEEADRVCSIVSAHHGETVDNSPEAAALRVLDAIDAFGEMGVYRYLEIYHRRGLRPPEIFSRAMRNLEARGGNIPGLWFDRATYQLLTDAYLKGFRILSQMAQGDLSVYEELQKIDWDLRRLSEILVRVQDGTPANDYFLALAKEIAAA